MGGQAANVISLIAQVGQAGASVAGTAAGGSHKRRGRKQAAEASRVAQYQQGKATQAQAEALANTANRIKQLIDSGEMSLADGLARIESHFQDQGGMLNDWFEEQMRLGTEQLQMNRQMVVNELRRNIDVAQRNVDRQQRDYLENEKRKLNKIEKDFKESNKQIREQLTGERLGSSGAFLAAVEKSKETYGEIAKNMGQSRSQYFRGLAEGFTNVIEDVGFRTQQAGRQFDIAATGLQKELGGQLRQGQMQLGREKFGAGEDWRQQSFELGSQLIGLEEAAVAAEKTAKSLLKGPRLTATGKQRRQEERRLKEYSPGAVDWIY